MAGPVYTRNAIGFWRRFPSFETALEMERKLAGDRRRTAECWTLFEGVTLYVGPRPRRRSSRHVVHLLTAAGAMRLGFVIPPPLTPASEVTP